MIAALAKIVGVLRWVFGISPGGGVMLGIGFIAFKIASLFGAFYVSYEGLTVLNELLQQFISDNISNIQSTPIGVTIFQLLYYMGFFHGLAMVTGAISSGVSFFVINRGRKLMFGKSS